MSPAIEHCSFCDKHKDRVGKLIVSHKVAICNECVDLCDGLLKDSKLITKPSLDLPAVIDPKDVRDYLDQHVVGQDQAKMWPLPTTTNVSVVLIQPLPNPTY